MLSANSCRRTTSYSRAATFAILLAGSCLVPSNRMGAQPQPSRTPAPGASTPSQFPSGGAPASDFDGVQFHDGVGIKDIGPGNGAEFTFGSVASLRIERFEIWEGDRATYSVGPVSKPFTVDFGQTCMLKRPFLIALMGSRERRNLSWAGDVPPQVWMRLYSKVPATFAVEKGARARLNASIQIDGEFSAQREQEFRAAMKELGLD